jgi:hypothetical protein
LGGSKVATGKEHYIVLAASSMRISCYIRPIWREEPMLLVWGSTDSTGLVDALMLTSGDIGGVIMLAH